MARMVKFFRDEKGVTAIEYAVIAGLIALGIVVALSSIGVHLQSPFNTVAGSLP